jgi:hypothetical protein
MAWLLGAGFRDALRGASAAVSCIDTGPGPGSAVELLEIFLVKAEGELLEFFCSLA